jgi:hypothetical protein
MKKHEHALTWSHAHAHAHASFISTTTKQLPDLVLADSCASVTGVHQIWLWARALGARFAPKIFWPAARPPWQFTSEICFEHCCLMLKEGDLHAPRNIQGTQACDCSIMWTAGECFAVISATREPSIRTFGHLFMDAERASD